MPILGIIASSKLGAAATSYESIATVTVGSGGSSSVTFSSIPSTYAHLQLRMIGRTNRASTIDPGLLRMNNISSSSYSWHDIYGDGASALAEAGSSMNEIKFYRFAGANATASIFGTVIIDILDYANTNKNKTVRYLGGVDQNGSGEIFFGSGLWQSTNAIDRLDIAPFVGTSFSQYSHFALYGIKST